MTRRSFATLVLIVSMAAAGCPAFAQGTVLTAADSNKLITRAHQVFDSLKAGSFAQVQAQFDATMSAAVPNKEKLAELWASIIAQTGALTSLENGNVRDAGVAKVVTFKATFANGTFNAIVAYNAEDKIAGLAVRPGGA